MDQNKKSETNVPLRIVRVVLLLCLSVVFCSSVLQLVMYLLQSKLNEQVNTEVKRVYEQAVVENDNQKDLNENEERFKGLSAINPDTVGWLSIKGTVIDYPVVQANDNDYYLCHNFTRKASKAGCIFMDYRNNANALGKHTILYGHSMKNGTMFRDLLQYKDQSFFLNNSTITFTVLNGAHEWEIFSAYVTDPAFYYIQTEFASVDEYQAFLDEIQEKSMHYKPTAPLTIKDQILTLSTCSYEFKDARMVVHARRVK